MPSKYVCLFAVVACAGLALADEPDAGKGPTPEDIIRAGMKQFHERMRSNDPTVREAEFDAVMADKQVLEKLFGNDANLVWPRLSDAMKTMRANTDKEKAELDDNGKILEIELFDVRKLDASGRYSVALELIPLDVPIYRAITRYQNDSAGSSSYVVIDGKMRVVRGLEQIAKFIQEARKGK